MNKFITAFSFLAVLGVSSHAVAADAEAGRKIAAKCAACHTFNQGGPNRMGPNLFGVTARGAGMARGYRYTDGFQRGTRNLVWQDDALMQYLSDPSAFLQSRAGDHSIRSKMTFKLPSEHERRNVIAYLKTLR